MKYLRLYEEFMKNSEMEIDTEQELSDKTIDDVLKDDFFDDVEDKELEDDSKEYSKDEVIHIKNWKVY